MAEEKKSSTWIHIDMTTICIVIALCAGAWGVRAYFIKLHNDEIVAVERAKFERQMKLEEEERKAEELRVEAKLERERKEAEALARNAEETAQNRALIEARNKAKEEELKRAREGFEEQRKRAEALTAEQQAEAQRKRKAEEEEAKLSRDEKIAKIRKSITDADKEIVDANAQFEPNRVKMIAFKNHMEGAMKQNETLRKNITSLQSAQGNRTTAGGTSVGFDLSEDMIKQAGKQESVAKDFRDAALGYTHLQEEKARLDGVIADAKMRKELAISSLKSMGVNVDVAVKPAGTTDKPAPVSNPATPGAKVKIYTMKDGKKYVAVKSIEAGDTISIKLESGKFEALNKDDIEKVVEE